MYTCNTCKNKFYNMPFLCSSDNKRYCSIECMPDSGIDKPYSFQYFRLIEDIRDISLRIDDIETLEDRLELERVVNDLSSTYGVEIYGDDEGLFYKRQIGLQLSKLDKLYDKIHNVFMERKIRLRPAVMIYWYELADIVGLDIASSVFNAFKEEIKCYSFENVYWSEPTYEIDFNNCLDKLCVDTTKEANEVKKLFNEILNGFKK